MKDTALSDATNAAWFLEKYARFENRAYKSLRQIIKSQDILKPNFLVNKKPLLFAFFYSNKKVLIDIKRDPRSFVLRLLYTMSVKSYGLMHARLV
ncbi:hypothetical protein [Helicobacter suis]|uniref:hypothetical protein n=1 Tax=Helicobacter suis TaxID=104628 RepID=UPI0013CF772F|nr:hypothetical protein [Helicobacter suis]